MGLLSKGPALLALGLLAASLTACGPANAPPPPPPTLVADPPPSDMGPPGAGLADFDRGLAMIEREAYAESIPHFDRAIKAQPKNAEAVYYRALAYDRTGKREDAIKGYEQAIELDGKLMNARVNLGAIYLEEPAQPQKAIAVLEPATKLEPKATDVRENLAFAYSLSGDVDKAAAQYDAALNVKSEPRIHLAYAELLFGAKRLEAAGKQYKEALSGFSKDLKHTAYIAHRLAKSRAYDDCVAAFTSAIALKADEPGFHLHRGLCQHSLKKEDEARADYRKAFEINDKFQPAYYYLGVSYAAGKQRGKAQWALTRAVEIDPRSKVGKKAAEQLKKLIR